MLGYSNSRKALADHVDKEDKGVTKWNTLGGVQNVNIINESGLYSLILSSKLENAKQFKHWVTREVLPSIKKNGGYILNQNELSETEIMANAILLANKVIKEKNEEINLMKPKAEYFDKLVNTNLLTNFRNTAKEFEISQTHLIKLLLDHSFLYRDKFGRLLPYAHKNRGYFEVKEWVKENGEIYGIQTLITRYFCVNHNLSRCKAPL